MKAFASKEETCLRTDEMCVETPTNIHPTTALVRITNMSRLLLDQLESDLSERPDAIAMTYLDDNDDSSVSISYKQLMARSFGVAAMLKGRVNPGETVVLAYPHSPDFVYGFLGCLLARVAAVCESFSITRSIATTKNRKPRKLSFTFASR